MSSISSTISFDEHGIDRRSINGALRSSRNATMLSLIGNPRGTYDQECRGPTNQRIANMMETADLGPFRATGLKPAVATLQQVMADVKAEEPAIYEALSSAGMLCCRLVRGSRTAISNHSWGTAIDLKIEGKLDRRGDGRTQRGLLAIAPIFNRHKFFWGAAFRTEDAMHFEASEQLVHAWSAAGAFGTPASTGTSHGTLTLGDRGPEVEALQEKLNLKLALDIDEDGIFGKDTKGAVMEFQHREQLVVDGIVGKKTAKALGL